LSFKTRIKEFLITQWYKNDTPIMQKLISLENFIIIISFQNNYFLKAYIFVYLHRGNIS